MAVVKSSSRGAHGISKPASWPNSIPRARQGSGSRCQVTAARPNCTPSSHRTYPVEAVSVNKRIVQPEPSSNAFEPVHRVIRPSARSTRRISVPRSRSRVAARKKANTVKQKHKENKKDDSNDSFDQALTAYNNAYEARLLSLRKWVNAKHAEHRIDFAVKKELNAYFGKRKFGDRPSAKVLSKYACQALELSEHDLGTDLAWARAKTWIFGERWGNAFGKMIEASMGKSDYGVCGPGYVGEEDVESWAEGSEYWESGRGGEVGDSGGEELNAMEVQQSLDSENGKNGLDWNEAGSLDTDEVKGLGFLDEMGNVPMEENPSRYDEEMDIEINLDL